MRARPCVRYDMRMRNVLVVCAVIAVGACKSKSNDTRPAPSPTPSATTTASASTTTMSVPTTTAPTIASAPTNAGPRPRYLRRQKPDVAKASSVYDDKKTHEKHPANDAFDGDHKTAWTEGVDGPGKGEWLEADFTAPRKVWSVMIDTGIVRTTPTSGDLFTSNAHAKRLRLQLDDADAFARDVAPDETQIGFEGIDRNVQHVRVIADDVYPGSKWADFGITELAILMDAASFPSVPEATVQSELANLDDHAPPDVDKVETAKSVLRRFGVNPPQDQFDGHIITASLQKASLVDDKQRERVLTVTLQEGVDGDTQQQDVWIVFLATTDDDRLIGLGSEWISAKTLATSAVTFTFEKLHSTSVDDLVARWSVCDADAGAKGCDVMRAWSLERGFVEKIADATADDFAKLKFDAKAFVYR